MWSEVERPEVRFPLLANNFSFTPFETHPLFFVLFWHLMNAQAQDLKLLQERQFGCELVISATLTTLFFLTKPSTLRSPVMFSACLSPTVH